ncbi:MAG: hypothetical protein E7617_01480 [Ruminococcaceae bacterium]|nr:hypothetical protein [Oscillospiraceae bacterium]
MNKINILMCGNDRVLPGMELAMLSLIRHTDAAVRLYIGTMDLSDINERFRPVTEEMRGALELLLKSKNPESEVILRDFGESFRRDLIHSKNINTGYTPYTMIRLFANEIEDIGDKLLYLDTDVLLQGDVLEIYDLNIDDYHIAGVRDYIGKFFFSPRYLNAGVILFNMNTMRRDRIFEKCILLCNNKKMLLCDQHALNRYAKRRLILNRRFNEQKRTAPDTLIRHFSMTVKLFPYFHTQTVKPWQPELVHSMLGDHSFDDIFKEYDSMHRI